MWAKFNTTGTTLLMFWIHFLPLISSFLSIHKCHGKALITVIAYKKCLHIWYFCSDVIFFVLLLPPGGSCSCCIMDITSGWWAYLDRNSYRQWGWCHSRHTCGKSNPTTNNQYYTFVELCLQSTLVITRSLGLAKFPLYNRNDVIREQQIKETQSITKIRDFRVYPW